MQRIDIQTRLSAHDVIDRAAAFFGPGGNELTETERDPGCISFEGGGGFVSLSVTDEGKRRTVVIDTQEYEEQVRRFLKTL
jgi:hypothetical protein